MSKVKNISGGPLDVPLLGRVVEDGETVEVPDDLTWSPAHFEPVEDAKPAAKASGKADS